MKKIIRFILAVIDGLTYDLHNAPRYKKALVLFLLLALSASVVSCSHHNRRHGGGHTHHYEVYR